MRPTAKVAHAKMSCMLKELCYFYLAVFFYPQAVSGRVDDQLGVDALDHVGVGCQLGFEGLFEEFVG